MSNYTATTSLGCRIRVIPAPQHLGAGVLMRLDMDDPGDPRTAEVFLTVDEARSLSVALAEPQ